MDMKDRQLDDLLKNALEVKEKPDAKLLLNLKSRIRKEELTVKKPVRRLFGTFAATIAIFVILTTTALAAVRYWSNFERLEEVIGSEQAGMLQPVELGTVTEVNGIRAEVVAVGVFYNIIDIYLTLEDLEGDRLASGSMHEGYDGDDSWALSYMIYTENSRMSSVMPTTIIDRSSDGIVTMHLRSEFSQEITEQEITFSLENIWFVGATYHEYAVDLDLQTLALAQPSALHFDREQVIGMHRNSTRWGMGDSYWMRGNFAESFQGEGLNILEPYQHDIELINVDSVGLRLSSIGIIDGRLHIQIYNPNQIYGSALITLRDANMEIVEAYMLLGFSRDEYGDFVHWGAVYNEAIFEIDLDSLADYQLHVLSVSFRDNIGLGWEINLDVENFGHLAFHALDITYDTHVILQEVVINPMAVMVYGEFMDLRGQGGVTYNQDGRAIPNNPEYHVWSGAFTHHSNGALYTGYGRRIPRPEVRIHTTDGIIEAAHFAFVKPLGSHFSLTLTIEGMVNLDSVVAVEINGVVISL